MKREEKRCYCRDVCRNTKARQKLGTQGTYPANMQQQPLADYMLGEYRSVLSNKH